MSERQTMHCHRMSVPDRWTLVAAYAPVIAFAALLVATRIPRTRRRQLLAAVR